MKNPPILEKNYDRDKKCKTCSLEWVGINVGYYPPNNRWYEIRPRTFNSENVLCRYKMTGGCYRDWRCRRAHNPLEMEIWIEEERLLMQRKRPSQPKFGCIICHKEFRDNDNLKTHLMGNEHHTRTFNMWILPDVGSSIEYKGPIRSRPKLPYGKDSYEPCRTLARSGRCQFGTGCKHAHSEEELRVWMAALMAKRNERHDQRYSHSYANKGHSESHCYSSSSQEGACRYPSESSESYAHGSSSSVPRSSSKPDKGTAEFDPVKEVHNRIRDYGIEPCLKNFPKHIQITCSRSMTITVEEKNKENELKWVFGLKTTQPEYLSLITLWDHNSMFCLGDITKCSFKGAGRIDLKQPNIPNRTTCLVQQAFNQELFFEAALLCKPEVGVYKVQVVFQIKGDILIAKEVKVKLQGEGFKIITEKFRNATKHEPVKVTMVKDLLKVNWEISFKLINTNPYDKYPIPSFVETWVTSDRYSKMNDQFTWEYYTTRFHTLLYLEEFEHKRSLLKYDLQDQKITFHNVEKQITIENEYGGRGFFEKAIDDCRFITFKLNQRLFEGYRSFRPPKIVYIIPNGTKKAYEYKIFHTGADYVVVSITTDLIKACQWSKGLALVRFTVERDEYVRMHQALDYLIPSAVFPVHRLVQRSPNWDEDHLLSLLDYELLSMQQKEAVYSIIDSNYQSFPTILCAPFGCGKTKTLSVAAKLIAQVFYMSRVLIVTKTNSCANMYIGLLRRYFDTITMLRERSGNKQIMFRHFAKRQKLHFNKEVNDYANIETIETMSSKEYEEVYKEISFSELEQCSIIVTTLSGCATLIPPESRFKSKSLFTHIFIDEAAQVIEPEACIALSLAGANTKIALAGDIHQSRPLVLSKYGKMYNLDQSLLQRLEMLPEYEREPLSRCKVNLVENFRSQHTIVEFLSELFYEDSLIANPPSLVGPVNFPALSFLHVSGDEQSLHGFPSFYNEEEAQLTIKALRKFAEGGVCVDRIAVVTTYKAQVRLIHEALREGDKNCKAIGHITYNDQYCIDNKCINNRTIEVFNLERIQGREYDLIIINTVRTLSEETEDMSLEERLDLGLLDDVSQFNTILTRARGWVLVIGDSDCLTRVGGCSNVWSKYIQACKQVNGFFETYREFEAFRMQIGDTRETNTPMLRTKNEENARSKFSTSSDLEAENAFDSKHNSLQYFINTCYQELAASTDPVVQETLRGKLYHAKIEIEAMEHQRYIEQKSILSNYKPGDVPQSLSSKRTVTLQPDMIRNEAMLTPTRDQLNHKKPM